MKKIICLITVFSLLVFCLNAAIAGDRQQLPKAVPTELGVDGRYYEITSVQVFDLNNDTINVRFILAIFATQEAKKELGFGQYEIKIYGTAKSDFETLIFPLLTQELNKEN
jgi:hypothetical protein